MRSHLTMILLFLLASGSLIAQEEFAPAVRIQAGDAPLDVSCFRGAAPFLGDFDGDGLNDLLLGHDNLGRLRIYRNQGSNERPRFDDYELFRVNGEIAELPSGGEFHPQLVDYDGDGKLDIVTTSESGLIFWYRGAAKSEFAEAELLKLANGQVLSAGTFAACHAVDWDGDGDTDLLLSGRRGDNLTEVVFVENTGTPESPSLSPPTPLKVDDQPIQSKQAFAYPFVADWNGDGTRDLLLGLSNGSVLLYENRSQSGVPALAESRPLIAAPNRGQAGGENGVIHRRRGNSLCVVDWDNDGTFEILIGDQQSEQIQPELTDEAEQLEQARREAARVLREYRRVRRLSKKLDETQQTQKDFLQETRKKFAEQLTELREKIAKLETAMQPRWETHGFVWLLRRETPPRTN